MNKKVATKRQGRCKFSVAFGGKEPMVLLTYQIPVPVQGRLQQDEEVASPTKRFFSVLSFVPWAEDCDEKEDEFTQTCSPLSCNANEQIAFNEAYLSEEKDNAFYCVKESLAP